MKLAPDSAEAHVLRGDDRFYGAWDWTACETEFRLAVELAPRSLDALDHYAGCRAVLGQVEESARQLERAKELDPLSPEMWQNQGTLFYRAHQPSRAIECFLKAIELDPRPSLYFDLGLAYDDNGNTPSAHGAYMEWIRGGDLDPDERKLQEKILNTRGNAAFLRRRAQARLEQLQHARKIAEVSPLQFAAVYAALGENDKAFAYLEQAYKERSSHLPWVKVSRVWDPLRADSRFQDLLRRMKLD